MVAAAQASRFDYVAYDAEATSLQAEVKAQMQVVEALAAKVKPGRAQALILTKLEETYMWFGKAIRDDQIKRNGGAELQESRGNE